MDKDIPYKQFPAIKIGRLAVHSNYHDRRVGTTLIFLIVGLAYEISPEIGMRFVSVDAYLASIGFYERNYFTIFVHDGERKIVQMYLDILRLMSH